MAPAAGEPVLERHAGGASGAHGVASDTVPHCTRAAALVRGAAGVRLHA